MMVGVLPGKTDRRRDGTSTKDDDLLLPTTIPSNSIGMVLFTALRPRH